MWITKKLNTTDRWHVHILIQSCGSHHHYIVEKEKNKKNIYAMWITKKLNATDRWHVHTLIQSCGCHHHYIVEKEKKKNNIHAMWITKKLNATDRWHVHTLIQSCGCHHHYIVEKEKKKNNIHAMWITKKLNATDRWHVHILIQSCGCHHLMQLLWWLIVAVAFLIWSAIVSTNASILWRICSINSWRVATMHNRECISCILLLFTISVYFHVFTPYCMIITIRWSLPLGLALFSSDVCQLTVAF